MPISFSIPRDTLPICDVNVHSHYGQLHHVSQDRDTRRGGGVCLYFYGSLVGTLVQLIVSPESSFTSTEYPFIEVIPGRKCRLLGVIDNLVDHQQLIFKPKFLNMSDAAIGWFKSYLNSRFKRAKNGKGEMSNWGVAKCGVPQGYILAPILCNLYTIDLGCDIKNYNCHKYANDFNLYISGPFSSLC